MRSAKLKCQVNRWPPLLGGGGSPSSWNGSFELNSEPVKGAPLEVHQQSGPCEERRGETKHGAYSGVTRFRCCGLRAFQWSQQRQQSRAKSISLASWYKGRLKTVKSLNWKRSSPERVSRLKYTCVPQYNKVLPTLRYAHFRLKLLPHQCRTTYLKNASEICE